MMRQPPTEDVDSSDRGRRPWLHQMVWAEVAAELRSLRARGFAELLTEDSVRFCAARTLVEAGVDVAELRVEAPHPVLKGSRIDLLIGRGQPAALIEFKYPREPNPANAAWTMTLGEVLKDFYRLATYPGPVGRVFVYVESDHLRRYMTRAAVRHGIGLHGDTVTLRSAEIARLPATASGIIGRELATHQVTAQRIALLPVDDTLRIAVYQVEPANRLADVRGVIAAEPALTSRVTRDGARREILDAIRAVLVRSGGDTFTPAEIVTEMARRGTGYAESTIRTMITAHLCRNAPDNAAVTYDDLERVDRGRYRPAAAVGQGSTAR